MATQKKYDEIAEKLENYYSNPDQNIWRNSFHIEMPFGLVNDPNGLAYFDNKFHIFYQWNPFTCEHKSKHWGLVTTKDFLNYTTPEIILKPEDWFDKTGCYSGGAYVKDDVLKLFYTGNVKDENNNRNSYQCLVDYQKNGSFEKRGVVIEKQPEGYTDHFRDPVILKENDKYYMIIGIQNKEQEGKALIYESLDLEQWNFKGELQTKLNNFGYMWECPNLFRLSDDKHCFLFSPQGLREEEFRYQNIFQTGYIIGDLDLENNSLNNHTEFKEIDMGFDFYAPQIFNYNEKNIMIAWVGMPDRDSEYVSRDQGWIFGLSLPRELEYRDGALYQQPFEQIKNLRDTKIIDDENKNIENIKFDSRNIECNLEFDISEITNLELKLVFGDEDIKIKYNKEKQVCILDRTNMQLGGKGQRKFILKADKKLKLHMFIDNSVVEIFYQDGQETTTFVYFPKSNDFEIKLNNNIKVNKLEVWKLKKNQYLSKN